MSNVLTVSRFLCCSATFAFDHVNEIVGGACQFVAYIACLGSVVKGECVSVSCNEGACFAFDSVTFV